MTSRRRKSKSLTAAQPAECLEVRQMLTAQITAELVGDQLNIVEEGAQVADAEVEVVYMRSMGGVSLRGLNGTTINGQASEFFAVDFNDSISIDLGSGDDSLKMSSYDGTDLVLRRLNIDMGSDVLGGNDNDVVEVQDINAATVNILTAGVGEDVDSVTLNLVQARELLAIGTGNMDDVVTINDSEAGEAVINTDGGLSRSDSGNDEVYISGLNVRGDVTINTAGANAATDHDAIDIEDMTVLDSMFVEMGNGNNDIMRANRLTVEEDLMFEGGEQADLMVLRATEIGHNLIANTYGGRDTLLIRDTRIGNWMVMETGDDIDFVELDRVLAFGIQIRLGEGDDTMIVDNSAASYGSIDGGAGRNTLNLGKMRWLRQGGFRNF
ncbi:MAG: hypothetical protein R3C49_12735 [Planctomycetaceae bacterium]